MWVWDMFLATLAFILFFYGLHKRSFIHLAIALPLFFGLAVSVAGSTTLTENVVLKDNTLEVQEAQIPSIRPWSVLFYGFALVTLVLLFYFVFQAITEGTRRWI